MRLRRTLCSAGLVYGLGIGAISVSGGCGEPSTTGARAELSGQLKERSVAHGKRMVEYYAAKKAAKNAAKKEKAQ
jgi:hypothetical protein